MPDLLNCGEAFSTHWRGPGLVIKCPFTTGSFEVFSGLSQEPPDPFVVTVERWAGLVYRLLMVVTEGSALRLFFVRVCAFTC